MTYRSLSCSTTEDATGKPSGKNRGKKNILALLLVPALLFPSVPAGGADNDGGNSLEKCLGKTKEFKSLDADAGVEASALIFTTALLIPELVTTCIHEYDTWGFLGAGVLFLANEFLYMKAFKSRSEEFCRELDAFKENKRDKQIKALELEADNQANAAKAVQARSDNYRHTGILYAGASAMGPIEAVLPFQLLG